MVLPLSSYEYFAVEEDCFVHLQNDIYFICQRKFAFFHLSVGGFDLTPAALRCKHEFDIGAVNTEIPLFTFFLVSNKFLSFRGLRRCIECPFPKYVVAVLYQGITELFSVLQINDI